MKRLCLLLVLVCSGLVVFSGMVFAGDCPGGWTVLPRWDHQTAPCRQLGLDSHQGVCLSGQPVEILCDDAKGGKFKICYGKRACVGRVAAPVPGGPPCILWDFQQNRPCSPGRMNRDCRGGCESM